MTKKRGGSHKEGGYSRQRIKVYEGQAEGYEESALDEKAHRRTGTGARKGIKPGKPTKGRKPSPKVVPFRPPAEKPKKKKTTGKKKAPPRVGTRKRKVAERRQPNKDTAANLRRHMRRDAE